MKKNQGSKFAVMVLMVLASATAVDAQSVQPVRRGIRPRLGIAAAGAVIFDGPGVAGGLAGQLGIQFGDAFAVYYLGTGLIGTASESGGNYRALGTVWNTAMFELTLGNTFQIGAGPSLDIVVGCESFRSGQGSQTWCSNSGPYFGLDGRIAMAFGGGGESSRTGFFIALDGHPTFLPNHILMTATASFGIQMY